MAEFNFDAAADIVGGLGSIGGGIAQAGALRAQADWRSFISEINAQYAEQEAKQILELGAQQASQLKKETKSLIGSQRTSLAAQGVSVDYGSAAQIQEQTKKQGDDDAFKIQNNAFKESQSRKREAFMGREDASMGARASEYEAQSSILTGGLQAAGSFLRAGESIKDRGYLFKR